MRTEGSAVLCETTRALFCEGILFACIKGCLILATVCRAGTSEVRTCFVTDYLGRRQAYERDLVSLLVIDLSVES